MFWCLLSRSCSWKTRWTVSYSHVQDLFLPWRWFYSSHWTKIQECWSASRWVIYRYSHRFYGLFDSKLIVVIWFFFIASVIEKYFHSFVRKIYFNFISNVQFCYCFEASLVGSSLLLLLSDESVGVVLFIYCWQEFGCKSI